MSTINAHGESLELLESLLRMMLMAGAQLDDTHRVTILSTAAASANVTSATKNDAIIEKIEYKSIASTIRQLDKTTMGTSNANSGLTAYCSTASCSNSNNSNR